MRNTLVPYPDEQVELVILEVSSQGGCMSLNPWYITGLIEGEGCFSVSFTLRKKLKVGIETRPSFSISLNHRDLALIKAVHQYFKCGAVRYSRGDRTYKYEVRSIKDLIKVIIPHFKRYPLTGKKLNDFQLFEEICENVHSNLHRSSKHLVDIIEKAYQMNPCGQHRYDKQYLLKEFDKEMV